MMERCRLKRDARGVSVTFRTLSNNERRRFSKEGRTTFTILYKTDSKLQPNYVISVIE